jgi:lysophospholipase L1-like esterase
MCFSFSRCRNWLLLLVAALASGPAWSIAQDKADRPKTDAAASAPAAATAAKTDKWESAIAAFEADDKKSPPPKDAVLFVGSSSIRLWDLQNSFPEYTTINRGFGGSQMSDVVRHADRIVTPYKPRAIVLYEGDNDLNAKKSPETVAADFAAFLKIVRAQQPKVPILVIGCKPSPSRWKLIEEQRELNRLLVAMCEKDGHATLVDIEKPMLGADGEPRKDLFRDDMLHLNDAGYAVWASLVEPLLAKHAAAAK